MNPPERPKPPLRPTNVGGSPIPQIRIVVTNPSDPPIIGPSDYYPPQSDGYLRIKPPLGITFTVEAEDFTTYESRHQSPKDLGGLPIPMVRIIPPSDTPTVEPSDYLPPQSDKYLRVVPFRGKRSVENITSAVNDRDTVDHLGTITSPIDPASVSHEDGDDSTGLLPLLKVTSPDERDENNGILPPSEIDFPAAIPSNTKESDQSLVVDVMPPLLSFSTDASGDLASESSHFTSGATLRSYSNDNEEPAGAPTNGDQDRDLEDSVTQVTDNLPPIVAAGEIQSTLDTIPSYISTTSADAHDEDSKSNPASVEATKTERLIQRLAEMCKNKKEYRKILACRGSNAQRLLDMLQRLLDTAGNLSPSVRPHFIAAAQRLAEKSGLYPTCYELDNVTSSGMPEGSGGFADIYKGVLGGQAVVWKEAILWEQLRHPNILPFYGVYRYKGMPSLVAPWMVNGDIQGYLKHHKKSNRVALAFDVVQGLQFLHENSIVHGDLKGGNILINESGRACIADFGLSSISDIEILTWTSQATLYSKGGTARWQAPEILDPEGDEGIHNTTASDIYAWSCVAYEIFADQLPFAHLIRNVAVTTKVLSGQRPRRPPDSSSSWSVWGLTEEIWALMEACWAADPKKRPTIRWVSERLERFLPQDVNGEVESNYLSPGQFREMTRHNIDENELSVETLQSILTSIQE
ncbi:hypothetical protein H0H92_004248 [Tricholoma furcatifolium]|nr:hypothetical protein H0H92_004248 [Tricholoma furcatifolium]